MIRTITPFFLLAILFLEFQSCNPSCESLVTSNIAIPPGPYQEGTELAITASPASVLEGRSIFLSFRSSGSANTVELNSRFEKDFGAAIVEVPTGVSSDATFLIEDPDCTGNLIPLGSTSSIVDESFFIDNPFFIAPTPPIIIIPTPPVAPPPLVVNAWFSPNNRDYCIWFVPSTEIVDGKPVELPALVPAKLPLKGTGTERGSVELAVGCGGNPATDRLYHANPVSGIVDKENNIIRIAIDRTSKGLGIEEYEGQFINPATLPEAYIKGGVCSPDNSKQPNIMFLTSLKTGRQLILFREAD